VAIKGKRKTKGRRPKAAAPKPVVVTPKQPLVARRWFQITVVAILTSGLALGIGYGFGNQSSIDASGRQRAAAMKALTSYRGEVDAALEDVGPPAPDGFQMLPDLPTADSVRSGEQSDRQAAQAARDAVKSTKAASAALQAIDVDRLKPGLPLLVTDAIVGSRDVMREGIEAMQRSALLLQRAAESEGVEQAYLLDAADQALAGAKKVFASGSQRYILTLSEYSLSSSASSGPPGVPPGMPGPLPGGIPAGGTQPIPGAPAPVVP